MDTADIQALVAKMSLEEKAGMCSGAGFWTTKAVERVGIASVMMADGPHGIRKQDGEADHLGLNKSVKTVCFPTGTALGSSFDTELLEQLGACLGTAAEAEAGATSNTFRKTHI